MGKPAPGYQTIVDFAIQETMEAGHWWGRKAPVTSPPPTQ